LFGKLPHFHLLLLKKLEGRVILDNLDFAVLVVLDDDVAGVGHNVALVPLSKDLEQIDQDFPMSEVEYDLLSLEELGEVLDAGVFLLADPECVEVVDPLAEFGEQVAARE